MAFLLGVDIGGTKMEVSVFQLMDKIDKDLPQATVLNGQTYSLKTLESNRIETKRQNGYDSAFQRLSELCQQTLANLKIKSSDLEGVGLAIPGPIDPQTNTMTTGNSGIFIGHDLATQLKKKLDYSGPVKCQNDANCFTLAEAVAGAGNKLNSSGEKNQVLGVILGTGVGGGFFTGKNIYSGQRGGACEWGHVPLFSDGHPCYCGNNGCVEQYLSGPAIEAAFASRMYMQIPNRPSAKEIFALNEDQDPVAIGIVKQYKRNLAKFLAILCQVYDPGLIVLGGGLSLQKEIYEGLQDLMVPSLFIKKDPPEIVQHKLGDSAGVLGAALLPLF